MKQFLISAAVAIGFAALVVVINRKTQWIDKLLGKVGL